jgi:G3E family GTPase
VAAALWADEAVEPGAALDGIVTLVDAPHFVAQLSEPQAAEAALQVAYADVILLNKTDLLVRRNTCDDLRVCGLAR